MEIKDFELQDGDIVDHMNIGMISISPVDDEDDAALFAESEIVGPRWYWDSFPIDGATGVCTDEELRDGAEIVYRGVWSRQTG